MKPDKPCSTGKTTHETMAQATAQLVSLKRTGEKHAANIHAYRCKLCGNYHIGHKPGIQRGLKTRKRERS